jgi:NitT/TauT family transport system substrate-binding protein
LAQDDGLEDVKFFLTYIPNIQFAPVYVGVSKGYFADEGLNLSIEHGDEPVGVDLIASGEFDAGVISGEQVILARYGQRPVVYVYEWFQKYPVGIVIPDTVDVETVTDLEGMKVGIAGRFGASYSGFTALLGANELAETDIDLEPIGFVAPDVMCAGDIDAAVIYVNNEPLQIQQRADAGDCGDITSVSVIAVSDYADMVSNGLVVSEDMIANNPERVQAMVRAFDRGLQDVLNNPAEAYLISLDYVENLPINDDFRTALTDGSGGFISLEMAGGDHEALVDLREQTLDVFASQYDAEMLIQYEVLQASLDLWEGDQPGFTDPASWEITQSVLLSMDMLGGEITLEDAYTNDFLPAMSDE